MADSLIITLFSTIVLFPFWPYSSHHWLSYCLYILILPFFLTDANTEHFAAGFLIALLCITIPTDGIAIFMSYICLMLLSQHTNKRIIISIFNYFVAFSIPISLSAIWLIYNKAFNNAVYDIFIWPINNYKFHGVNDVGILSDWLNRITNILESNYNFLIKISGLILYVFLPLFSLYLIISGCAGFLSFFKRNKYVLIPIYTILTALEICLFLKGRPDWNHFLFMLSILFPFFLLTFIKTKGKLNRSISIILSILLASSIIFQTRTILIKLPTIYSLLNPDAPIANSQINYWLKTKGNLRHGDKIAAFPEGGEVYFYLNIPATGYTQFLPLSYGYHNLNDHNIVAKQLLENNAKLILMPVAWENDYLDNKSPVAFVLRKYYRREIASGEVAAYRRIEW